jgi:hypothetical protein
LARLIVQVPTNAVHLQMNKHLAHADRSASRRRRARVMSSSLERILHIIELMRLTSELSDSDKTRQNPTDEDCDAVLGFGASFNRRSKGGT